MSETPDWEQLGQNKGDSTSYILSSQDITYRRERNVGAAQTTGVRPFDLAGGKEIMGDTLGNPRLHTLLDWLAEPLEQREQIRGGEARSTGTMKCFGKKKKPTPLFEKRKFLQLKCPEIKYIYIRVSTALYILKLIIDWKTAMAHKHQSCVERKICSLI